MYIDIDEDVDNIVGEYGYAFVHSRNPFVYKAVTTRKYAEILRKLGVKLLSGWAVEGKDVMHPDDEYLFEFTEADRLKVFNVLGIQSLPSNRIYDAVNAVY